MKSWLQIASAVFAFGAAVLWFWSATIRTPKQFNIQTHAFNVPQNLVIGPTQEGYAESPDSQTLGNALIRQSRLSGRAAICAAIAAGLQGVSAILSYHLIIFPKW